MCSSLLSERLERTCRFDWFWYLKYLTLYNEQVLLYVSTKLINGLTVLGELKILKNGQTTVRFIYLFIFFIFFNFI